MTGHAKSQAIVMTKIAIIHQRVLAIPGTGKPHHLAENVAAGTLRLSAGELTSLESTWGLRVRRSGTR